MALNDKQKNRLRGYIRVCMVVVAILLLLPALVIPIANNGVALGVQRKLEALPMPEGTTLEDATSVAGKLTGSGNGMQYLGAVLLHSTMTEAELKTFFTPHLDSLLSFDIKPQQGEAVLPDILHSSYHPTFSAQMEGEGWYVLYGWGTAPGVWRDILNTDMRGH